MGAAVLSWEPRGGSARRGVFISLDASMHRETILVTNERTSLLSISQIYCHTLTHYINLLE